MEQQKGTATQRGRTERNEHRLEVVLRETGNKGGKGKKSFVVPGHCRVKHSDAVTWEASETHVLLFFPNRKLFGRREVEIAKGGTETLTVSEDIPKGHYPYAIYCAESDDFAEGGSFPRMIVD